MKAHLASNRILPLVGILLAACSGNGSGGSASGSAGAATPDAQANYPGADLGMPPVADGFVRYETQPVMVGAQQDVMWEEWVAPPLDSDMDVVAISGLQSAGGHHALLLSTMDVKPIGTNRPWKDADQLTTRTVGGVGGEGNDSIQLPPGVVFRVKKGSALLIQSHFINTSVNALESRSVIDLKLGPVDTSKQVASLLSNTTLTISLPPNTRTTIDVRCKVPGDLHVLMYANHMHDLGVSASTELVSADGTATPLKVDPKWDPSWAFHPNYTTFAAGTPALFPAGSTIHTTCTWDNTKGTSVGFPDEMCVFAGFYLGDSDVSCVDGAMPSL